MNKTNIGCVVIDLSLSSVDCVNHEKKSKIPIFCRTKKRLILIFQIKFVLTMYVIEKFNWLL